MKRIALAVIFCLAMAVQAMSANTATPTLDATWEYSDDIHESLAGFTLYKEGVAVCSTDDPTARQFACTTQIENRPIIFTLSADSKYGEENNKMSEPFEFVPEPSLFEDLPNPSGLIITIPITINVTVNGVPQ